jgi:uncharacterized membrane protein
VKFPLNVLDDMAGFGTLGASLGGLIGSLTSEPGILMLVGGQLGALCAIMIHLIRRR